MFNGKKNFFVVIGAISTACLLSSTVMYSIYYLPLPPLPAAIAPCLDTREGMEALRKLGRAWKGTAVGRCGGQKHVFWPEVWGFNMI